MEIQREKNCTKRLMRKDGTIFREFIENTTANGVARIKTVRYPQEIVLVGGNPIAAYITALIELYSLPVALRPPL